MDKPFAKSATSVEEARRLINSGMRLVDAEAWNCGRRMAASSQIR